MTVQAGAYAEHQFLGMAIGEEPATALDASSHTLRLDPGAGARLTFKMKRYANPPTLGFPWDRG